VRPFVEADIPQVAELHRRVFQTGDAPSAELERRYRAYFRGIFLDNPWYDEEVSPLVYEDADGSIAGFLGVMPRRMSIRGRPIQAAVSSQFIVEPGRRSTMAAVHLMKTFMSGPQDVSIADEANCLSRKLWESLGGATALLHSIHWARLLRPAQFGLLKMGRGTRLGTASVVRPLCRLVDGVAAHLPRSPFRHSVTSLSSEDLDVETLLACLSESSGRPALRPEYDARSLRWLLGFLVPASGEGSLHKSLVRDAAGQVLGWYLYYAGPAGLGEAIHIGARHESIKAVLEHLFQDAWRRDVVALSGRLDPRFTADFAQTYCLFHPRLCWMLVHSRDAEVLQAIQSGDAMLTRLEGEWCMRFQMESR
jgi:GNAT acetyltransferase-like protein